MKVRHTDTPLPRIFKTNPTAKGILHEGEIIIGKSRVRAKVLIFDKPKSLRHFWKNVLGKGDLGKGCLGAVNGLGCEILHVPGKGEKQRPPALEVDPRYYCIIGLCAEHLCMEIICHEAIHAAFAYAKRIKRNPWSHLAIDMDEEAICYPAGKIAAALNNWIHEKGLYK